MSEEEKYEKIEQYLANTLPEEERQAFEAEMVTNPSLQAELELHMEIAEAIQEEEVIDFENTLKTVIKEEKQKQSPRKIFSLRPILSIAASVLIVLVGGYFVFNLVNSVPTAEELLQAYLSQSNTGLPNNLEEQSFLRSNDGNPVNVIDTLTSAFFETYRERNYLLANDILDQIALDSTTLLNANILNYFKGVTHFQLDELSEAVNAFEEVNGGNYTEKARWFKALALLKLQGNTTEVKEALNAIITAEQPEAAEAATLLKALN